jgi:hypothetical protein
MMEPGKGDTLVAKWDVADMESVGVSEEEFDKMMGKGGKLAYTADGASGNTAIDEFDPSAETIVIIPIGHGG